jgi:hypothetical protein
MFAALGRAMTAIGDAVAAEGTTACDTGD